MADNTTISLPEAVKDDLDGLKEHEDEPYWKVLRRLIESHNREVMDGHNSPGDSVAETEIARLVAEELNGVEWHVDTEQVADEVAGKLVADLTAQLPRQIAEELEGRL